jgi:hypothetical protein
LIGLQLGTEEEMLQRAIDALEEVDAGETAFLSESLAWTPEASGRAYAALLALAQRRDINIVTTLNLGGELIHDLPGHDPMERYGCVTIFTRHGVAHVVQGKCTPQSFESDVDRDEQLIGLARYARSNLVTLDVDEELVRARFFTCSDVATLARFRPVDLACDLLVVLGCFPAGAEKAARRLVGSALEHGVAASAVLVNAFHAAVLGRPALADRIEEVLDAAPPRPPAEEWESQRSLRSAFFVYPDGEVDDFVSLATHDKRRGRIPVAASVWDDPIALGVYPVTVVF